MTARSLKLRDDLVISEQDTPTGPIFVVKDAARSRFFRLREPEFRIVEQLDGRTPPEAARRNVEARFGATIARETFDAFLAKLARLGLLEDDSAERPATGRQSRVRGSVFYLRLAAFDPDRLLARLAGSLGFCFTPQFVAFTAALVLFAGAMTLVHSHEIARDLQHLYRLDMLVLAWTTVIGVTVVHEFAHGVACRRFGGRVHEMGVLLIYLQPALYCNVSDAWLFPERARRLWVTFAGAYVELVAWALATLLWRVTDVDAAVNHAALVVMATSSVKLGINLNPLIKLDGYYLLSDWLDIPNLRQRAFAWLGARLRGVSPHPAPSRREARVYLGYGLLAGAYTAVLIAVVTVALGRFLVTRYQGLGFVIFVALVFALFGRPLLRRLRPARPVAPEVARREDPPPAPAAQRAPVPVTIAHAGVHGREAAEARAWLDRMRTVAMESNRIGPVHLVTAAPARADVAPRPARDPAPASPADEPRSEGRRLVTPRRAAWTLGLLAAVALLLGGRMALRVSGDFRILPVEHAQLRAAVAGIVGEILVDEGEVIEAGTIVARLSDRDHRAALRRIAAEIDERRAQLKMLKAGPRVEEIAMARAAVEKNVERVSFARRHLAMFDADRNLVSRKELDEAREQVAVRDKDLDEARERLAMLVAGNRPEEIEASEAALARLVAEQAHVEEELRLLDVTSTISGVVTTTKPREKVGQHVAKGDAIVDVHALHTVTAEIAISEKDIGEVRVGQPVRLKARAYPWTSFEGRIVSIAPVATKPEEGQPGTTVVAVTRLENPSLLLKPEMTGNAKIDTGERRLLDLVTRRFARYLRVEFWSWW